MDSFKKNNNLNAQGIIDDDAFVDFILKCSKIKEESGSAYLKALYNIGKVFP